MSKIVKAVNVMVSNPDLITNAIKGEHESELFFYYDKKYAWSIIKSDKLEYFLHYYPENNDISLLACIPPEVWPEQNITSVAYSTKELGTKEAYESFQELYGIIQGKLYNMDSILDEIIKTEIPF